MEERLDILTPDGQLTGQTKPKAAVHRDGDWHAAVHVWIRHPNGHLLIQRRSPQKINDPDLWDISVAGHVASGETLLLSAQREVEEEIGLQLQPTDFQLLFQEPTERVLNEGTYIDREWQTTYLCTQALSLQELSLQASEVAEVRWIALSDFAWVVKHRDRRFVPHWQGYQRLIAQLR